VLDNIEKWEEQFDMFHDGDPNRGSASWRVSPSSVKAFISSTLSQATDKAVKEAENRGHANQFAKDQEELENARTDGYRERAAEDTDERYIEDLAQAKRQGAIEVLEELPFDGKFDTKGKTSHEMAEMKGYNDAVLDIIDKLNEIIDHLNKKDKEVG